MGTIEFAALAFAAVCVAVCALLWIYLDRRHSESYRELASDLLAALDRERALASELETERVARVEAQTRAIEARIERDNVRAEVLTRLDKAGEQDAPNALAGLAERAASLVLAKLPMEATERERYAACAALGGLMSAHAYVERAVLVMAAKADLEGPIWTLRVNDAGDDDAGDDTDRHSDPDNLQ